MKIKCQNPTLVNCLQSKHVCIATNKFQKLPIVSIGFLTQVHPMIANCDVPAQETIECLKEAMVDANLKTCKELQQISKDKINLKLQQHAEQFGKCNDLIVTQVSDVQFPKNASQALNI